MMENFLLRHLVAWKMISKWLEKMVAKTTSIRNVKKCHFMLVQAADWFFIIPLFSNFSILSFTNFNFLFQFNIIFTFCAQEGSFFWKNMVSFGFKIRISKWCLDIHCTPRESDGTFNNLLSGNKFFLDINIFHFFLYKLIISLLQFWNRRFPCIYQIFFGLKYKFNKKSSTVVP